MTYYPTKELLDTLPPFYERAKEIEQTLGNLKGLRQERKEIREKIRAVWKGPKKVRAPKAKAVKPKSAAPATA